MLEVADIFRRYGEAYLEKYGAKLPLRHRRAFQDILHCRTPALGGHLYACDHCGHQVYSYHSCRNRSCPKCHGDDTEAWLEKRRKELLPVEYFHVVFTLPKELRHPVRSHPEILYGILMKAAAQSLIKLAADPRYVGGLIGVLAVLHTWTRTLHYHPHVHCLVPAGGVSDDQKWLPARKKYLVPVKALSRIFRGMFREMVAKAQPDFRIPEVAWKQEWVVYCKPTFQGADNVLELPHVPRPSVLEERPPDARGQLEFLPARWAEFLHEMVCEDHNVISPVSQRGKLDAHAHNPEIQVLSELRFLDHVFKVPVGGGNNSYIDLFGFC